MDVRPPRRLSPRAGSIALLTPRGIGSSLPRCYTCEYETSIACSSGDHPVEGAAPHFDEARSLEIQRSHDSLLVLLGRTLDLPEQACCEADADASAGDIRGTVVGDLYVEAVDLVETHFSADLSWRLKGGCEVEDMRNCLTSVRVALGWTCIGCQGSGYKVAACTSLCRELLLSSTACVVDSPLLVYRGADFLLDHRWDSRCMSRAGLDLVCAVWDKLRDLGYSGQADVMMANVEMVFGDSVYDDPATATRYVP